MFELREHKKRLRDEYLTRRKALEPRIKRVMDEKICSILTSLAAYRYADTLLVYYPMPDEIDIKPFIEHAWADGKSIAFPKCRRENRSMTFHIVSSFDELSENGMFGIPEPMPDLPVYDPENNRLQQSACIIPAVIYDRSGYRIGYGKGYYDRYLPSFSGSRIGVCYSGFITDKVPRGKYDLAVNVLVTEKGVRAIHI